MTSANSVAVLVLGWALCGVVAQAQETSAPSPDAPITAGERLNWVATSTLGPQSLAAGAFSAGFGTLTDKPSEYGTHWDGFGRRYGMRLTGVATGNVMEAGFGALWGEDPRYFRAAGQPFKSRLGHAVKMTFLDRHRGGELMPAYARYLAIGGNNFVSNTWRADSEATDRRAAIRVGLGFLGHMVGNLFQEFWPDAKRALSGKNSASNP